MKIETKEVLKVFLPILQDILKKIFKRQRIKTNLNF